MLSNVLEDGKHILSGIKADIDIPMSFGKHADAILLQIDGIRYVIYCQ